jgi:hypothetical protein
MCHPYGHEYPSKMTAEQLALFQRYAEAYSWREPFPDGRGGLHRDPLWLRARDLRMARRKAAARERLLAQAKAVAGAAWSAGEGEKAGTGVAPKPAAPPVPAGANR